ncbi:hypothetical protein M0804_010183 [Polistes exclamans]|nr:hypothetical protein M0804_010183 [Polistes exclamans]
MNAAWLYFGTGPRVLKLGFRNSFNMSIRFNRENARNLATIAVVCDRDSYSSGNGGSDGGGDGVAVTIK